MTLFLSLVIFGLSVYLFFITNNKIRRIKENILIEDTRKELEGLLTEFNSAAARNIELLESKIGELQEVMKKAAGRMVQLDDKIDRANRPIVVQKYVDRAAPAARTEEPVNSIPERTAVPQKPAMEYPVKTKPLSKPAIHQKNQKNYPEAGRGREKDQKNQKKGQLREEKPQFSPKKQEIPPQKQAAAEPMTRSETLKKHLQEGVGRQELIAMGFQENEINLLSFLIRKKV